MKIRKSTLKRIIQEEMGRLSEKTDPSTLEIDPEAMEFTVMAEPDRPGEAGVPRRIRGKVDKYKGRYLPKALSGEDYFDPEHSGRQVSGMLSSQLRDTLNMQMTELGFDAAAVTAAQQRVGKSQVMASALADILASASDMTALQTNLQSLESKVRSKADKQALADALTTVNDAVEQMRQSVAAIAGIKYGFSLPDMDFGEEV